MPRRLLDRFRPESTREFRLAARQRFDDGLVLASAGQRTGAVYLWGYTAEMTLKSAYFSLIGLAETDSVTWRGHLLPAIDRGRAMGIAWPTTGQGHNVRAWSELLIADRATAADTAYAMPFAFEVQRRGQRIERLWRETLLYHRNLPYTYELAQVREAAEWLLVHSDEL